MNIITILSILILVSIMPIFIGSVFLQIVLAKKKNKFLGLILPLMTLIMSSLIIFGTYSMDNVKQIESITNSDNEEISEVVEYYNDGKNINFIIIAIIIFFYIPIFIYLVIYFSYSKYRKELTSVNQDELIKMNTKDLE